MGVNIEEVLTETKQTTRFACGQWLIEQKMVDFVVSRREMCNLTLGFTVKQNIKIV